MRRAGPAGPQGPHVFADSQAHARALDAADGVIDGRAFGQQVWWCGGCAVARRRVPQAVVRCLCVAVPVFFLLDGASLVLLKSGRNGAVFLTVWESPEGSNWTPKTGMGSSMLLR